MATYVKGDAVANATSYELFEKVNGAYNSLATANEINFEVSALGLEGGNHSLVVKAKADGYEDSDYSNEVVFNVPMGAYWIGEKLGGNTHGSGASSSYLGTQYYYITDEAAISELSGKTVDKMAFNFASKSGADTPTGTITVYLVNSNDSAPNNWEVKAEIAVESYPAGSQKEFDIPPFVVPAGYTIGYRASKSNIIGGGYLIKDYKFNGAYYASLEAASSTDASLGGVDVHIQG